MPGAVEALRWCKARGLCLAVLSNAADASKQNRLVDALQLRQWFDGVVVSADAGFRKPDTRAFDLVLQGVWGGRFLRSEVCMVGDMLNRDILGARRCGMVSVLVTAMQQDAHCNDSFAADIVPDAVARDLFAVPAALAQLSDKEAPSAAAVAAVSTAGQQPRESWPRAALAAAGAPTSLCGRPWPWASREAQPLKIGYLLNDKKAVEFQRLGVFDTQHRADVQYEHVRFDELLGLAEQAPGSDLPRSELAAMFVKVTDLMVLARFQVRRMMGCAPVGWGAHARFGAVTSGVGRVNFVLRLSGSVSSYEFPP